MSSDTDAIEVFIGTVDELGYSSRIRASDYEAARSAALVRRLLNDQKPLAHRIESIIGEKFQFEIARVAYAIAHDDGSESRLKFTAVAGAALDPDVNNLYVERLRVLLAKDAEPVPEGFWNRTAVLNMEEFLEHEAARQGPHRSATVRQIVRLYANYLGGVHFNMESDASELLLDIRAESPDFLRETMLAIGRVVRKSMEPAALVLALKGSLYMR